MATLQNRKPKGITGMAVFDKSVSPKVAYPIDTPGTAELDPGIEEVLSETRSDLGEIVIESAIIDAQRPIISATMPGLTPTALALRLGKKLKNNASATSAVEKRIRLTATNNNYAGASSGQEGFGMSADQTTSYAWVLSGLGIPTALTRVAHASFDETVTNDSFSQGANGAYKFSDNLIGSDVLFQFPQSSLSILEIGEASLDDLEVNITVVMRDLKIFRLEIPSCSIDLGGSGPIPLGAGEISLQFRVTYDGSTCTPINYKYIDQVRAC
ncbi:MAG: hypothetical protein HC812_19115 [Leptolyngbya sp. RL_3_1]|nr:hypothetical protein [Leptolyngbya sp. RL_3_1]